MKKQLLALVTSFFVAFAPLAHAVEIELRADMKIRTWRQKEMQRVGLLTAGSRVSIPDAYTVFVNNQPHFEHTLNNWLRNSGNDKEYPTYAEFDGEKKDYFFPVKVTHLAPGSTLQPADTYYMALRHLALNGTGLIVTGNTAAYPSQAVAPAAAAAEPSATSLATGAANVGLEAASPCPGGCPQENQDNRGVRALYNSLAPALDLVEARTEHEYQQTTASLKHIGANFSASCGFALPEFIAHLKKETTAANIPPDVMLAIMTQESRGKCWAINSEKDTSQSRGLFQINTGSSAIPACTRDQRNVLRGLGMARIAAGQGPQCLDNPAVNLREAMRIAAQKYKTLTSKTVNVTFADGHKVKYTGFDASRMASADMWRAIASAYNGGETWVLQAKQDLEAFNQRWGANLNSHNWEDLRVFYLRRHLNRAEEGALFGRYAPGRGRDNALRNLAYTENVLGRNPQVVPWRRHTLTDIWRTHLDSQGK